jgi:ferritin-like metal-binding protein YciE
MKSKTMSLRDLLIQKLQALYDIESELMKAIPEMVEAATDPELKTTLEEHLEVTIKQEARIKEIFTILNEEPDKLKVDGIRGIIKDANWVIKKVKGDAALNACLVASARYVEHYEMAGYISARTWAEELQESEVAELLEESLEEEIAADNTLATLAERLNTEALGTESLNEEEEE